MFARFTRMVPLFVILGILALIIYVVVSYQKSPNRAKEVLISLFTGITGGISVFFALASLYAWFENNADIFDLFFSFFIAALLVFGLVQVCRMVFYKNHPSYRYKASQARVNSRFNWRWKK